MVQAKFLYEKALQLKFAARPRYDIFTELVPTEGHKLAVWYVVSCPGFAGAHFTGEKSTCCLNDAANKAAKKMYLYMKNKDLLPELDELGEPLAVPLEQHFCLKTLAYES